MEFRLLGLLAVEAERGPVRITSGRESALLALLLLHRDEPLPTDRIVDELWGETPPEHATKSVQVYVSRLRKALGADRIETTPAGYQVRLAPGELDIEQFEEALRAGRWDAALALWRGEPLADFRYLPFAQTEARRLHELHATAVADGLDERIARGEAPVSELEAIAAAEPLWERPRAQLMRALYLAGRQADALELYRETRRLFADELGVEPSPELQALERAILNHDPALGTPAQPRSVGGNVRGRRLLLAGGLLLVAAAGGAAYAATRHGGRLASIQPNSVAVIDAKSDRLVAQVGVGDRPSRLASAGTTVWVLNAGDRTISAIDTRTDRAAPAFGPSLVPSDLAATPDAVWVGDAPAGASAGASTIARFDPTRHVRAGTTRLRGAPSPGGGRPADERYLITQGRHVWAIGPTLEPTELDAGTGKVQRVVHIPVTSLAAGDGAVWAASGRSVVRIDPRTGRWTATPVSSLFYLEGIASGGGAVWATSSAEGVVWRIVTGPLPHVDSIPVGYGASTIAYGDGAVWVGNRFDDSIVRIDPKTEKITRVATVPAPQDITVAGNRVYVAAGVASGRHGPITSSACGKPVGPGRLIIASDLPLEGAGSGAARAGVRAIQKLLRARGYRAGRYRLAYQSCDDASPSAGGYDDGQCLANAATYATDSSVVSVFGTYDSACAADEIPVLNRAPRGPLAMISPFDTGPFLTRGAIGDAAKTLAQFYAGGFRNFFRTIGADHIQVAADAVLAKRLGMHRIAVISNELGMLQRRTGEWFAETARKLGLQPVPVTYDGRSADLQTALRRARADSAFVASAVAASAQQAHQIAIALGSALPHRPVIVTDYFGPSAVTRGSRAEFFESSAVPRVRLAMRTLLAAIATSDGSRRSISERLARHFDRWGDPTTAPIAISRWSEGGHRLEVITPPANLVPAA